MGAFRHRQQQAGIIYDLIPPERGSGSGQAHRFMPKPDIVDAEFVTVSGARGRTASGVNMRYGGHPQSRPQPATRKNALSRILSGLRGAEEILQQASRRSFVALIVSLAILIFGLSGGFSGLSGAPAKGGAGEPLQFSHVTLTPRDENGLQVLKLNGIIENASGATLPVPQVRADLFAGDQLVRSIVVDTPIDRLGPHESRGFSTRLQHPGGKTPDVRLSFMP